ncbi:MAG: choice-of-anchor A family protein [Burkholderiaceae bacterium]
MAGEFNLFSLGNFNVTGGSFQGAVAAAGDVNAASFSINSGKAAYGGDAVVAGGNLTLKGGSISNGNAYVGGKTTVESFGFGGKFVGGDSPVDFAEQAAQLRQLSIALSGLAPTGNAAIQWGGMTFTGSGSGVDVFNLAGKEVSSVNWGSASGLHKGDTVILNIGGNVASLQGGLPDIFKNYNVLYNFYEATSLSFNGVGVYGSVLAPLASVKGGSGNIDGNVIVADWNSNVSLMNKRSFDTTEVAQYAGRPPQPAVDDEPSAVPEPSGIVLFMLALSMLAFTSLRMRRRQQAG